jgi:hypothetical protein
MIEQLVQPDGLGAFVAWLRAKGYQIDVEQICDLQYLFLNLRELGAQLHCARDLTRWVVPVLSQSPAIDDGLRADIADWWRIQQGVPDDIEDAERMAEREFGRHRHSCRSGEKWFRTHWIWLIAVVALVLAATFAPIPPWQKATTISNPGPPSTQAGSNGASGTKCSKTDSTSLPRCSDNVSTSPAPVDPFTAITWLAAIVHPGDRLGLYLLLSALLLLMWKHALDRKVVLKRALGRNHSGVSSYHFPSRLTDLISDPGLLVRLRELRIPRLIPGRGLDVTASLKATREASGFIRIVEEQIALTPEYLLLVERRSLTDHFAYLGDQLQQRLREVHIFVDRYEFHLNPRRFLVRSSRTAEIRRSLSLEEVIATHERQRLILVTDGDCLIDPVNGRPYAWLEKFRRLPVRVILTPRSEDTWGEGEALLKEIGFLLLPADRWGLNRLIDLFIDVSREAVVEQPIRAKRSAAERGRALPHVIRTGGRRLLSPSIDPDEHELRVLLRALRGFLREPTLLWIQACAVFPKLDPRLTLHLGRTLTDERNSPLCPREDHEGFLALSRLPWFQHGFMPDWLRRALVRSMPPSLQPKVMIALERLLRAGRPNKGQGGLDLELAQNPALGHTREEYELARNAMPDDARSGPLEDYLFLGFMAGGPLAELSVEAPPVLRRKIRWRLWRTPTLLTAIGAALFLALAMRWPPNGLLQGLLGSDAARLKPICAALILLMIGYWTFARLAGPDPERYRRFSKAFQLALHALFVWCFLSLCADVKLPLADRVTWLALISISLVAISLFAPGKREPTVALRLARLYPDPAWMGEFFLWFVAGQTVLYLLASSSTAQPADAWGTIRQLTSGTLVAAASLVIVLALNGAWTRSRGLFASLFDYAMLYHTAFAAALITAKGVDAALSAAGVQTDGLRAVKYLFPFFAAMVLVDLLRERRDLMRDFLPWLLLNGGFWLLHNLFPRLTPLGAGPQSALVDFWIALASYPLVLGSRFGRLTSIFRALAEHSSIRLRLLFAVVLNGAALYSTSPTAMAAAVLATTVLLRTPLRQLWRFVQVEPAPSPAWSWRGYGRALLSVRPRAALGPVLFPIASAIAWPVIASVSPGALGKVVGGVICLGFGLGLWRGRRNAAARGVEHALYWLESGVVLLVLLGFLSGGSNLGAFASVGLLLGAAAMLGSGVWLIRSHWDSSAGAQIAVYWLGSAIAAVTLLGFLFEVADLSWISSIPQSRRDTGFFTGIVLAVTTAGTLGMVRRRVLTAAEVGCYWLLPSAAACLFLTVALSGIAEPDGKAILVITLISALVALLSGLVLAAFRWRDAGPAELAVYWVGFGCCVGSFLNTLGDIAPFFDGRPGIMLGMLFVIGALTAALLLLRRHRPAGGEMAFYWFCLYLALVGGANAGAKLLGSPWPAEESAAIGTLVGMVAATSVAALLVRRRIRLMRGGEFTVYALGCALTLIALFDVLGMNGSLASPGLAMLGLIGALHWWVFAHRRMPISAPVSGGKSPENSRSINAA